MKKSSIHLAIVIFTIALFKSNNSFGQSQDYQKKEPPTFSELLKEMDKDENGKLSKSEIQGPLKNDFDKVDEDEDGFITAEEFKKAPKPKRRARK